MERAPNARLAGGDRLGAVVAPMTSSLKIALELWRRGLSVIPVPRPRRGVPAGHVGDGKRPAISWAEYQKRLPTEDELHRWFTEEQNVAIITALVSGVVMVDADSPEALRWCTSRMTYTPWQVRTRRGFHLYYAHPGVHVSNRARIETNAGKLALEVRGDGGLGIAPGSLHASGHVY